MDTKKIATGFATALTLVGGGAVTDAAINPYEDKADRLELKAQSAVKDAGENKIELVKERPEVRLKKWDGEVDFGVRYDKVRASGSRQLFTDRMEWKGENEEVHAYPLEAGEGMEDGGFEIEVVLSEPPESNVFTFTIDGAEDLDFFYQPELTQEEIDEGMERPENVVGSYAVYHKEKRNHVEGQKNYATGKAFHIYRPKAIDADGNETWAILEWHPFSQQLTVTVSDEWLAKAAYPVRVDPTFGYTSVGATIQEFFLANQSLGTPQTVPADFSTLVSITSYGHGATGTESLKALFTDNTGVILTNGVSPATALNTVAQWWTNTYVTAPTPSPSASVNIGLVTNGNYIIYGDQPGGSVSWKDNTNSYASPTDPTVSLNNAILLSLYATYTASTSPSVTTSAASSVTTSTATLNGNITDDGGASITEHGFAWGTASDLSTAATTTLGAGTEGAYTDGLTSLSAATTYYFRAYATNSEGTGFGSILNFTTSAPATSADAAINGGRVRINGGGAVIR